MFLILFSDSVFPIPFSHYVFPFRFPILFTHSVFPFRFPIPFSRFVLPFRFPISIMFYNSILSLYFKSLFSDSVFLVHFLIPFSDSILAQAAGLHNMGSAGSAAPRKFEGKSSFGRKYWSFEEMHRKSKNDHIRKYF